MPSSSLALSLCVSTWRALSFVVGLSFRSSPSLSLSDTRTLSLSPSISCSLTHSLPLPLSFSLTPILTLTLSLSHTHSSLALSHRPCCCARRTLARPLAVTRTAKMMRTATSLSAPRLPRSAPAVQSCASSCARLSMPISMSTYAHTARRSWSSGKRRPSPLRWGT